MKHKRYSSPAGRSKGQTGRASQEDHIAVRNRIVESNLRLVVALAKKYVTPQRALDDLVADASLSLIRCVESFDVRRGTRFSTYATRALIHFFAKLRRADLRRRNRLSELRRQTPAKHRDQTALKALVSYEDLSRARREMMRLDRRTRLLLEGRFGLTGREGPLTFRELGQRSGLSKERVRVLTAEALDRLRTSLEESPSS